MTDVVVVGAGVASARLDHPGDILRRPVERGSTFDPAAVLGRGFRYKDRSTQLGTLAAARALADASLLDGELSPESLAVPGDSVGVVASSNLGNLDTVCRTADVIAARSVTATRPMDLPNASSNVVASSIAVRFGLRGPNVMVCNGASSGLDAVHLARVLIASGRVPRVVVVGVEPTNDVVENLVGSPAEELFDGAVAMVVESEAAAVRRGAVPRARLGRYARLADVDVSVTRVLGEGAPPALWLVDATAAVPTAVGDVPRTDLETALGAASGALGVLQVLAGVQWLDSSGAGPVLATAGTADDGVSSLLLTGPGLRRDPGSHPVSPAATTEWSEVGS